jgi:Transcription factor WhiB
MRPSAPAQSPVWGFPVGFDGRRVSCRDEWAHRHLPRSRSSSVPGSSAISSGHLTAASCNPHRFGLTAATPDSSTDASLIELAISAGYAFGDQRWRLHAACAGVDPEVFLTDRGASPEPALAYCRRCEVRAECLQAALELGQRAVGV